MDSRVRISAQSRESDIDMFEFGGAVAADWRIVASVVVLAAAVSTIIALALPPVYRAEVAMVQVGEGRGGVSSAAMLAPLGGLAGLAGIDLSNFDQDSGRARAILNSRMLVEEFISDNELLPVLFERQWDMKAGRWTTDADSTPTLWLGVRHFVDNVRDVSDDPATGVIRIGVEWKDPELAAKWANGLVALANEIVRKRDLSDAERNVAYLNDQIAHTNVVELQQVLYSLVESEMKTMMLANAKEEYAFAVIDPAVPPERRAFPHRILIVAAGTVVGGFLALIAVLLRLMFRRQRERQQPAA